MKTPEVKRSDPRIPAGISIVVLVILLLFAASSRGSGISSSLRAWWASATPSSTATPTLSPTPTGTPTPRPTRTPRPTPVSFADGQLLYVKHERISRGKGLPDTYQFYLFRFWPAPPGSALREYIRSVQRLAVPGMPADEFEKNMAALWAGNRALSNNHDYLKNFAVGPVITGGAMLRATGNSMWKSDRQYVEVYAIDPDRLPAVPARIEDLDWTLHFRPTIVTQVLGPDGRWDVDGFPQFEGWAIAPVLGEGGRQWIDAPYVVPINAPLGPFDYP